MLRFEYHNLLHNPSLPTAIPAAKVKDWHPACQQAHEEIISDRKADILGFYSLPDQDISHITDFVARLDPIFDTMVVLGIGGSALGNKALYSALRTERELPRKLFVYDNVDPVYLHEILAQIDLDRTIFNVITKSGTTAETMAGYMILADLIKTKYPQDYKKRLIITTDREKGFLRQVISQEGYTSFVVPDNVREGRNISVMMPYSNSLYDLADWYRQLWAESLGKRHDLKGREVLVGQTPVKALGTTDQHSQVQLYTEGPHDKVFTFLSVESFAHDFVIPDLHPDRQEVSYLGGRKLSELLNAERLATEIALTKSGRPNANIVFPVIDEFHLGEFIMMYEIQTVFAGKLLHINPLDQPGVEAGKIATYALMGKAGFDKERAEIRQYLEKKQP
jgi:glucose-6-phosphate isomerase